MSLELIKHSPPNPFQNVPTIAFIPKKIRAPFIAGIFYLLLDPLLMQASFGCRYRGNRYNGNLSLYMPSEEISDPTELPRLKRNKERLQDHSYDVWIQAKGDWLEILSVKTIENVSPMGLGFQADTDSPNPTEFELFHLRRETPCRFLGTALNKGVVSHHAPF